MNLNTKKKTCHGCRAYNGMNIHSENNVCDLGYDVTYETSKDEHFITLIPKEKCPKPLTYGDFLYANKWYRKIK